MRLEISLAGDVQVSRELLRFAGRIEDASPAFRWIADDLKAWEKKQFRTKGRYASGGWADLKDATIAQKRRHPNPVVRANATNPLRATGRLMESLTGGNEEYFELVQPHQLVVATLVPYAKFHQRGKGVPQRRPLEVRARDRTGMVKTLQEFMVGSLEGAAMRGLR